MAYRAILLALLTLGLLGGGCGDDDGGEADAPEAADAADTDGGGADGPSCGGTIEISSPCADDNECVTCRCEYFGHTKSCTMACTGDGDCPAPSSGCDMNLCQP